MTVTLHLGDCLEFLRTLDANSVDAVVTDPPYGLSDHKPDDIVACLTAWLSGEEYKPNKRGFMGRNWDAWVPGPEVWRQAYRVMKPGAYLFCFAGTRTDDLMSMAIRLAGFRKHPFIGWVFGSGFPKASNLGKMFDKAAGVEREVIGRRTDRSATPIGNMKGGRYCNADAGTFDGSAITAPATDAAREWEGWFYGLQSLKPAIEPVLMFQKPREGRMTENVLRWGTGALNIDASRIGTDDTRNYHKSPDGAQMGKNGIYGRSNGRQITGSSQGRWPANLITDGSAEVVAMFPQCKRGYSLGNGKTPIYGSGNGITMNPSKTMHTGEPSGYPDTGSASRFFSVCPLDEGDCPPLFYCAKSSRRERNYGLDSTCTVKYTIDKSLLGGLSCQDVSTALVESLRRATSESIARWSIGESGASITGLCQRDTLSITLTAISRITTSQILRLLTLLPTSESIAGANYETANGGNRVTSAESSSALMTIIGISPKRDTRFMDVARAVTSKLLSVISDGANWKPSTNIHSTVKPLSLMRYLITLCTREGATVLDPFLGSGTTGVAAMQLGRSFIGCELDADYFKIAEARIYAATPIEIELPIFAEVVV